MKWNIVLKYFVANNENAAIWIWPPLLSLYKLCTSHSFFWARFAIPDFFFFLKIDIFKKMLLFCPILHQLAQNGSPDNPWPSFNPLVESAQRRIALKKNKVWNSQLRQLWRRPKVVSQLSVAPLPLSLELSQMTKLNNFWVEFGFKFALKLELKSISIFTNSKLSGFI